MDKRLIRKKKNVCYLLLSMEPGIAYPQSLTATRKHIHSTLVDYEQNLNAKQTKKMHATV